MADYDETGALHEIMALASYLPYRSDWRVEIESAASRRLRALRESTKAPAALTAYQCVGCGQPWPYTSEPDPDNGDECDRCSGQEFASVNVAGSVTPTGDDDE
jgi:hypothetical protein